MKNTFKVLWAALGVAALALPAHAQFGDGQTRGNATGRQNGRNTRNDGGGGNGGIFPLPEGVNRVISIDAQNVLLAEMEGADGQTEYALIRPRHVYSGGLARLFGGDVIPTEQFVSPAFNGGNGNGGNGGNGFGGNNGNFNPNNSANNFGGGNNFGNNGPVFGGFNNGGYGNNGYGNDGGFVPNGPQVGNGFPGGVVPNNSGYFSGQNRIAPRSTRGGLSVQTGNPIINQVVGLLDRPVRQVEVGTTTTTTVDSAN